MSRSPKNMKKLLPKRKPERKPSEEDFTVRKSKNDSALDFFIQVPKVIVLICPHVLAVLRYSSFRGGRSDTESDRGLLYQC